MMKPLKYILITATAIFAFYNPLKAQSYNFSMYSSTYTDLQNTLVANTGVWHDDAFYIAIPFQFYFFDIPVSSLKIDDTGNLYFGPQENLFITAYGADMRDRGTTSSLSPVSYTWGGPQGSKIFKIEYKNCGFENGPDSDYINFQIWYYQNSNKVEIHYGSSNITQPQTDFYGLNGPVVALGKLVGATSVSYLTGNPSSPQFVFDTLNIHSLNSTPPAGTVYSFSPTISAIKEPESKPLISIFPVPASNVISFLCTEQIQQLVVYNIQGQEIFTTLPDNQKFTLDLSSLQKGCYLVAIKGEKFNTLKQIIKD